MKRAVYVLVILVLALGLYALASASASAQNPPPTDEQLAPLGRLIFFDADLSANGTESCATCHAPEAGYTGPDSAINAAGAVYPGAIPNRFGNRKPPSAAYGGDSPLFHFDQTAGEWAGGMFWDGRATGKTLGDPLAEQAQGPFLNPLEQAMPDAHVLAAKVAASEYADLFEQVWGPGSLNFAQDVNGVYERIARSVAAFERSAEVNPYTSKFDQFWDAARAAGKDVTLINCGTGGPQGCGGRGTDAHRWTQYRGYGLEDNELVGLAVFNDRAQCSSCHSLEPGSAGYPLFTNFGYDNIGVPKNPDNPFYNMPKKWNPDGKNWVDYGLGGYLKNAGKTLDVYEPELGKFKVPTLRNVDKRPSAGTVKAYGHNGYFKSLDDMVLFYHWRACMAGGGCGMMGGGMGGGMGGMENMFPPPEVNQNLATLSMFPRPQVDNLVAFLKTLSDGYYQKGQ